MLTQLLQNIGLKPNEANVYLALLKTGTTYAGRIVQETSLQKSSVYNALEYLIERGLVVSYDHAGIRKFAAEDPMKLEYLVEKQIRSLKEVKTELSDALPELYGIKNPQLILPKVRMYEGMEGIRTVLFDSANAGEEVWSYMNIDAMEELASDMKSEYVSARIKNGVKKKIIALDSKKAHEYFSFYKNTPTRVKYITESEYIFALEFVMYDNKVAYITYRDKSPIAIIIEDPDIYRIHRAMHQQLWDRLI